MKKYLFLLIAAFIAAVSCDIAPVSDENVGNFKPETLYSNFTIAELKALYAENDAPVTIGRDLVIKGQVISSDLSGNVYRSLFIQDETGALEIKIGKTSLYSDYKLGQWLYIKCKGLTLGKYGGMLQLGYRTDSPAWLDLPSSYETAYLDVQYLIDYHIVRGEIDTPVAPMLIDEAGIKDEANFGRFVRVEGLTYGNQIFCILYDNANNSLYLRDTAHGVDSWAMSENGFKDYMMATTGKAEPQSAFDGAISKEIWQAYYDAAAAYTMSQYFTKGKTSLQVRTSGYAKFADTKIDPRILKGATVNLTGILTYYNGNNQFTLIDLDGVEIAD